MKLLFSSQQMVCILSREYSAFLSQLIIKSSPLVKGIHSFTYLIGISIKMSKFRRHEKTTIGDVDSIGNRIVERSGNQTSTNDAIYSILLTYF
jgi:hypothetical protein